MSNGDARALRDELRTAVRTGRVHGAYLFEGPEGAGTAQAAHWFSRLLLCRAPGDEPCEACHSCRLTAQPDAPAHPDLQRIVPDGPMLRIEAVRDLQKALSLRPNEGGRRVGVVLQAERLNAAAANALLKTLEEPPPATTLVLVARTADALPATVRSRTTRLRFAPTPEAELRRELAASGLADDDAWLAAALGGGSNASAQAWASDKLADAREQLAALEDAGARSVSELLEQAEAFRGAGEAVRQRAELFLDVYDALARRSLQEASERRDRGALEAWLERADAGARARREMQKRNLNPQLVIEGLLLGLRQY
jgi:DNA polymerase III subunit delta'